MTARRGALLNCLGIMVIAASLASCGGATKHPRPGAGCEQQRRSTPCGVLFVGNSYTFANDLPGMFAKLSASGGRDAVSGSTAWGGATLADHVAAGDVQRMLARSTWNVVVMQEQSQIPSSPLLRRSQMYPAVSTLSEETRGAGALPLLLLTWAHAAGWPEEGLPGYPAMQRQITEGYLAVGGQLRVSTAPVGVAWANELRHAARSLQLWGPDGSHPSVAGTYLAACVLFATIYRRTPEGLAFTAGLPTLTAAELQRVASGVVLRTPWRWGLG